MSKPGGEAKRISDNASVALLFLRNYQGFGSRGHLVTAYALKERIKSSDDADERNLLAVKVYGEFIAAFES